VQLDAHRLDALGAEITHRLTARGSSESKSKRKIPLNPITMVFRTISRFGHQLRVRAAMKTLGNVSSGISRPSLRDSRTFKGLGVAGVGVCLLLNSQLRSVDGLARIGLCVATLVLVAAVAMGSGVAIRPFVRKAYGLNRARQLVAFDALPQSVAGLFSGLHLAPTALSSSRSTPLSGTDLDEQSGVSSPMQVANSGSANRSPQSSSTSSTQSSSK
jgi:hypothetical protein